MKCPNCQFENPEKMKFCGECGSKLEKRCSSCHFVNPPNFKFCGECGHSLTDPSETVPKERPFDEKLAKIQRYLPQGLTEKILSQKDRIEGERKQVTVMFCDMMGFTELSEKIGPEDAYSTMDQVYEILIHKVHEFGGTVNEMTGDGVLALFGAPISIEDAPQRAIRVAMAIHREMARFNDRLKQEQASLPALKMRIGIHTGPVVVGTLGNDLRVEFKAVGDTVNVASRLENLAEPGATYVSEDTFKLTEGLFRYEAIGEKPVKGKREPLKVYRVIATSSRRTRFDVSAERGLTPFVGRERELELLLDGFERARSGRGQAFSIMAEAGVGKSRLLYEFRKAVSNEEITMFEGKCLSYSRGVAYHPVIDILKSNFNILDTDDCDQLMDKVRYWLEIMGVDKVSTLPYLLALLSVKESGIDQIDMSPEARRDRIMSAVNLITLKGAESRPLVLAVEDLHWIDKSSVEYFKRLLESISGARVFLIFTYRPEYILSWGGKSYHSQINLNRLSNRESLAMVAHLLGTEDVDRDIEELVLEKTEGVPFFIEEFIRTLKDLKIIKASQKKYHLVKDIHDVAIPSTIQEVVMSRVDSLPEGAKELLQIGSVIDREFSYELIQKVSALPERELLSRLSVLKDMELIYERGVFPESSYIFKHTLTQEVLYDSILGKRKKKLHEKIGGSIEELNKENLDAHYELLSDHFVKADDFEKGAAYSRLICKKAVKKAAFNDAINYGKKRVECLESLPRTEDVEKKIIEARTLLGFYLFQINFYTAAKETVAPVIDLAWKHNYKKRLFQIQMIEGAYHFSVKEDFPRSLEILKEAIRGSEEAGDYVSLIAAHTQLGNEMGIHCEFDSALANLQRVMEISKESRSKWGIAINKSFQSYFVFNLQGRIDRAYEISTEAVQLAEESDDILSKVQVFILHGNACYNKRYIEEAKTHLLKGIKLCERVNLFLWEAIAQHTLGEIYYEVQDYEKSKNCHFRAILLLDQNQFLPSMMKVNKIGAARAMVMNNEGGLDVGTLCDYVAENNVRAYDGWMKRYIGEILMNTDGRHDHSAEDWIGRAIKADQRNGMRFHLAKDYALYADFHRRREDWQKARENMNQAAQIARECGADGWAEKYEKQVKEM